ncbi:lysine biosynthesis protein LysW [Kibdelosporangium lantanae]|uniref:Lysine biosynthesis protein LysW n=1 Tax=Kibdelosporangium lantanae TaxID=1497396 RepID=A0ABW3MG16_9PSEU
MITCPECSVGVPVTESAAVSEVIECGDCHSELEVVSVNPVRLATAPEIEEDWGE